MDNDWGKMALSLANKCVNLCIINEKINILFHNQKFIMLHIETMNQIILFRLSYLKNSIKTRNILIFPWNKTT